MNDPNSPQYSASSSQPSELRSNSVFPSSRFMTAPGRPRMRSSSMCAYPVNFRETRRVAYDQGLLGFQYEWDSSTGNLNDLSDCLMGEIVIYPGQPLLDYHPPRPPFGVGWDLPNPTTLNVDAWLGVAHDMHKHGASEEPYENASFVGLQEYWYRTSCMLPGERISLMEGIGITRSIFQEQNRWKYKIEKLGISSVTDLPIYEIKMLPKFSLEQAVEEIASLHTGITRGELLELFDYCEGFFSGHQMIFAYRRNPLIKVKVDFEPYQNGKEKGTLFDVRDKVIDLSHPFLDKRSIFGGI